MGDPTGPPPACTTLLLALHPTTSRRARTEVSRPAATQSRDVHVHLREAGLKPRGAHVLHDSRVGRRAGVLTLQIGDLPLEATVFFVKGLSRRGSESSVAWLMICGAGSPY